MTDRISAAELATRLADVFESAGIRYAVGGAIALGFYAVPRATVDVDINAFIEPDKSLDDLLSVLQTAGFRPDAELEQVRIQALSEGQFRGRMLGARVDVFVPSVPYYRLLADRRRQVPLLGRPIWILGPEDLVVLKMMFYRRKDLADVEAVLRDMGAGIELDYVRSRLVDLVGPSDPRIASFEEIVRDVSAV
jgi:hypothetical protein